VLLIGAEVNAIVEKDTGNLLDPRRPTLTSAGSDRRKAG
jgi:hypothetical protein